MDVDQEKASLQPINSEPEDGSQKKGKESINDTALTTREKPRRKRVPKAKGHKCNLDFPGPFWNGIVRLSDQYRIPVDDLLTRFAQLGLLTVYQQSTDSPLIKRRPGQPDEGLIVLV